MSELPLLFAFTAGLLATVNPCGFAMLPAYLSFFLGLEDARAATRSPAVQVALALRVGVLVSAGFAVVFGSAGVLLAFGVEWVVPAMPWVALAVGALVVGLGGWLLTGRALPVPSVGAGRGGTGGAFAFGVSYALASLSCTLPVLLTVVAAATAQPGLTGRLATVAAYAAGMALLLLAVTVALGAGKASLVRRLRALTPVLQRAAGGVLLLAGSWVIGYWAVILATGVPAQEAALADRGAALITNAVADHTAIVATVAVGVLAAGVTVVWRTRWARGDAQREPRGGDEPGRQRTPGPQDTQGPHTTPGPQDTQGPHTTPGPTSQPW